ncbi:actin-like ATPase domain-containing protein [Choiromyces venosus 120613-1]|uniref:Actin-like ATPase domain-containing protein n=1 Tax=Choiromyces venosus 120613-1 TaxID=1336337 RepID=A0A3N4J189_9PEZI|nr:actin-like ATPase domain-containing protein [Choiromyces venosus 120613-1]
MPSPSTSPPEPAPLPPPKLYDIREAPTYATSSTTTWDDSYKNNSEIAIVIDNGSWQTRAGFSHDHLPRLTCPPMVSKYRDRKAQKTYTVVGNDVFADPNSRGQAKTPFDSNVVSNFDQMETLLDYCFIKLGVGEGGGGVGHPVVMTEAVCVPGYNRKMMSELLFECYNAPSVIFGIDSLFSYDYNNGKTGLVMSAGHTATHLIPMVDGKGLVNLSTRLNWGGSQSADYMLKLIQLKYPGFPAKLQSWQAEALMKDHCYVSPNYKEEVANYLRPETLLEKDRIIQFPFTETIKVEKSQEELDRIAERRKESGRKLQEQAAKVRLEKLIKKEQELAFLKTLQARQESDSKRDFKRLLEQNDFRDEAALEKSIRELDKTIRRARKQDVGPEDDAANNAPPTFPLLDIPDEELSDDSKKMKRHQKLMKSNHEARLRAKAEKEAERQRQEDLERADAAKREADLPAWLSTRHAARAAVLTKIKDRTRLRNELSDRKSLASQMRMKSIANLASDSPPSKKRRRGPNVPGSGATGGGGNGGGGGDDDNFGANDDDWSVYRNITMGTNSDEDEEDNELAKELKVIEDQLLLHDPDFDRNDTQEAKSDWRSSLLHAFTRGAREHDVDDQAQANQIHLNMERIRVPEVTFQPGMAGLDQAGVIEIAGDILLERISDQSVRENILKDIFLTGGGVAFKGFDERVRREMREITPAGSEIRVRRAGNVLLDAWCGAARFAKMEKGGWVTRGMWEEAGGEYILEHRLGNAF